MKSVTADNCSCIVGIPTIHGHKRIKDEAKSGENAERIVIREQFEPLFNEVIVSAVAF